MRSRILGAHLGVSFSSGMKIISLPLGSWLEGGRGCGGCALTFCSATVTTHSLLFTDTHVVFASLEGFAPLVCYAYYTFQRWMSGLERR
jgi:hypothetical protein